MIRRMSTFTFVKERAYSRTENEPPKSKPPPKKQPGSYCVVVNQTLEEEGKNLAQFEGRSSDWDIIQNTNVTCLMKKNGKFRKGKCAKPTVTVEKFDERCNGMVSVREY